MTGLLLMLPMQMTIATSLAAGTLMTVLTAWVPQGNTSPPTVQHLGFRFEKGGCELAPLDCLLRRQPVEWTRDEIREVRLGLEAIAADALGKRVLNRCRQRGFTALRRYRFSTNRKPAESEGDWTPDAELYRDPLVSSINILDAFFRSREQRDHFSGKPGYLLGAQMLLHECFHAIDNVSPTGEFRDLVGFVRAGSRLRFVANTESEVLVLTRYGDEIKRTPGADRGEQWRVARSFALQMRPVRVPSMQSIQSPAEAFADIGSHLILDRRARKYLPATLTAYFDKHVFSQQDSK